jgi:NarL family two-component system sensor histidine kinase YdfH
MPNLKTNFRSSLKIDQDYRIFFIFMTLVLVGMYVVSLVTNPSLHQFWPAALFTVLMVIHIFLHWSVIVIAQTPMRQTWYILGQGLLAFIITYLSGNTGMIFSLYMALIGESIGYLGLTRWSLLSTLYFLALSVVNFSLSTNANFAAALFWVLTAVPVVIFIGMYVTLYLRQTEAREKAQALAAELEAANRQLSEYAARVEDLTITAERERMARELHDTLSQGLAGLTLQLEAADAHLAHQRPEKAREIIGQAMQTAREALADARRVISDLRENHLGELGDSLRCEVARFEAATGLPCAFHADSTPPLPDPVKETLLRTVSEALTNIARHARATEASVKLAVQENQLNLEIKDNGLGFDPATIPSGHYGLLGLRERARLIGGTLTLDTAPQKGTILTIEIPLTGADT